MRILVCPLNWGLGHATRSLALINKLESEGHEIFIASDGAAGEMLRRSRPDLKYFPLAPLDIRYGRSMGLAMVRQSLQIAAHRARDHQAVREIVQTQALDQIISDHRYGCYHPEIDSIFLCHQVHLPLSGFQARAAQTIHDRWMSSFDRLWIPDYKQSPRLAGILSAPHPSIPAEYIGPLTRFTTLETPAPTEGPRLAILSGPEPHRSQLEQQIRAEFSERSRGDILVRGDMTGSAVPREEEGYICYDYVLKDELASLVQQASLIIMRSGYSSLMDLTAWNRPARLIATPGQPEQEYLASWWPEREQLIKA